MLKPKPIMYDNPLISIITPVLNDAIFLQQTIQSVINQDYSKIEYIIIDGGSTDKTIDIIKKYEHQIDFWISEKDGGIYDAMNKGIFRCRGDYFAILNSGDFYADIHVISNIANILKKCPQRDFIFSDAYIIKKTFSNDIIYFDGDIRKIRKFNSIPHPSLFCKTDIFKFLGGFDTCYKVAADYDYVLKLIALGLTWEKLSAPLVYIRQGGFSFLNIKSANEVFRIKKKNKQPFVLIYFQYLMNFSYFILLIFIKNIFGERNFFKLVEMRYNLFR
jgi:glycosyltransferase involved in cell wall biosynthesis